jgi:hypothetical protein
MPDAPLVAPTAQSCSAAYHSSDSISAPHKRSVKPEDPAGHLAHCMVTAERQGLAVSRRSLWHSGAPRPKHERAKHARPHRAASQTVCRARKLRLPLGVVEKCAAIRPGRRVRDSPITDGQTTHSERSLTLGFEGFAWETIDEEATREGLTIEEFVTFSVLYYLADVDSGRVARRASRSPYPGAPD